MNSSVQQPMIVKYVESLHNGIQSQALSRYAIGYILRGTKYIYDGDKRQTLSRGDVFYLGIGHHYIENFPEGGQPFEQVLFYYTPGDLQRILMHLNITYGLNISNEHSCENCRNRSHVTMPAWNSLRNFFINTNNYLRDEDFRHDETAENIKMTELIYLIASHEDCCIKSKLLSNVDAAKENFEQTVYDHIFKDISIEELSKLTNRSLTSFKKEFRRHNPDKTVPVLDYRLHTVIPQTTRRRHRPELILTTITGIHASKTQKPAQNKSQHPRTI